MDGVAELQQRLQSIVSDVQTLGAQRAVRAGVNVLSRAIRAEIDAESEWSPDLKQALKRTVGRGSRRTDFGAAGRAGFGIGPEVMPRRSGRNRSGVGVGSPNAHWFVRGTDERFVGKRVRRSKRGRREYRTANALRYAGRLRPSACVARAVSASADEVRDAMARELQRAIESPS